MQRCGVRWWAQRAAGATLRRPGHLGRACPGRKAGEKSGRIPLRERGLREEDGEADRWGRAVSGGATRSRLSVLGRAWRAGRSESGALGCGVRGRPGERHCWAEHRVGREEGSGWARGKECGPGSRWARGEGKKRRWRAGPLRVLGWMLGLGFLVSFSFSISFSKQLKPI